MKRTELKRRTPLKRKTWMKRVSAKRRKLNAKVNPIRHAFVDKVGTCMVCRTAAAMDAHEIASGYSREDCLSELDLIMALCRKCHDEVQGWKPEKQIAARAAWLIDCQCWTYNTLRGTAQTHVTRHGVLTALEYGHRIKLVPVKVKKKRKVKQ